MKTALGSAATDFRPGAVFHSSTLAFTVREEEIFKVSISSIKTTSEM